MTVYRFPLTDLLVASARALPDTHVFPAKYYIHSYVPDHTVWLVQRHGLWEVWIQGDQAALPSASRMATVLARQAGLMPKMVSTLMEQLIAQVTGAAARAFERGEACPFCGTQAPHLDTCIVVSLRQQALT